MRSKLLRLAKSPLVKGVTSLLWGAIIVNVTNYVFNMIMGRMLGPVEFGSLSAVLSILYIMTVFSGALQNVSTQFASQASSQNDISLAKHILVKFLKVFSLFGLAVSLVFLGFSGLMTSFLNLSEPLYIIILVPVLFLMFISPIPKGVLLGFQRFNNVSLNISIEAILKLLIAILFVSLGFKTLGVLGAFSIATSIIVLLLIWNLRKTFRSKEKGNISIKEFFAFFNWTFLALLGITAFQYLDVILAKHYLAPMDAGLYAGISLMGKIIFYASSVIAQAMFPLVSKKHYGQESHSHLIFQSLGIVATISSLILLVYAFFPSAIIKIFLGSDYSQIDSSIVFFGLAMLFLSLSNVFVSYFLSAHQRKIAITPLLFLPLMLLGIIMFHNSIKELVLVQLVVMILMFLALSVQYVLYRRHGLNQVNP